MTNLKSIKKGIQKIPVRALLYGTNSVGKSTFASHFPNPIFIDIDGNLSNHDVVRVPIKSWEEFKAFLSTLVTESHGYNTLVIDSCDLLQEWGKEPAKKDGALKDFYDYGKGWAALASLLLEIRNDYLEVLNLKKRMHIVLISHVTTRRIERLDCPAHDMIMPSLSPSILPVFADWCNFIGYAHICLSVDRNIKKGNGKIQTTLKEEDRFLQVGPSSVCLAKDTFHLKKNEDNTIDLDGRAFLEQVKNFYQSLQPSQLGKGVK